MITARPTNRATAGFTLLELLVAVLAFAIVLAAINSVFYGALRLRNKTVAALAESAPLQQAVAILKRDLAGLVRPGGTMLGPLQTTAITNSLAGQASPDFYTTSGYIDETSPWADVQRVSYALVSGPSGIAGQDLVRAVSRNMLPPAGVVEQPMQQWLLSGVQRVGFSYYDGTQWRETWDSTVADPVTGQTNTLPAAIRVQIQMAAKETGPALAQLAPIELVVPLMVQTSTNQTAGVTQ